MKEYREREIKFKELLLIDDWSVKTYLINKKEEINSSVSYQKAVLKLPEWLKLSNSFNPVNDKIAFLIIHFGDEGVFSVINWWVGENMLNTHVFLSSYTKPERFNLISGDGLGSCIWELEVINHERNSWIKNVLKNSNAPDYKSYLEDEYSGMI